MKGTIEPTLEDVLHALVLQLPASDRKRYIVLSDKKFSELKISEIDGIKIVKYSEAIKECKIKKFDGNKVLVLCFPFNSPTGELILT